MMQFDETCVSCILHTIFEPYVSGMMCIQGAYRSTPRAGKACVTHTQTGYRRGAMQSASQAGGRSCRWVSSADHPCLPGPVISADQAKVLHKCCTHDLPNVHTSHRSYSRQAYEVP